MRTSLALMILLVAAGALAESRPDAAALSRELDALYRSDSSHGTMTMEVVTPHYARTLTMEFWSKGLDYTLVRILSPKKEKGVASLKRENEMWNYIPRIKKTLRVPPSMMMGSWMGSDFTNDDLMRETSWESDYSVEWGEAGGDTLLLVYRPREGAAVTWARVEAAFNAESRLPYHQDFFDEKGRLARRIAFGELREMGGRRLPTVMTLIPYAEDKRGHRTVMRYDEIEFDIPMPLETFSQHRLRQMR